MKTKKYLIISALALLACSCQTEDLDGIQPTPGQDVQFGASLEKGATRTVYGDREGDAFPIYWQNGDEVIVSSPECAEEGGVGSATYKVSVDGQTQNYATSLDKTGDIGVRWGDNQTGTFYSFYPASHAELGSDYSKMTVTMPAQQDNNFVKGDGTQKIMVNPDMNACFMYACSTANSGSDVNLRYIPLSTAIRFTLKGPDSGDPVGISYVRIYAPEVIDGSFTLTFSGTDKPTLSPVNGRNYVTMNAADTETQGYLTLGPNESAELCAFLLIPKEMPITNDWYMEISTTDGHIYKKSLGALEGENTTLIPGQVHYLPDLPALQQGGDWDPANWMSNIQRNVYLSEISIPGSWNSVNTDCQPVNREQVPVVKQIQDQYSLGIRAFHLDTRWIANRNYGDDSNITGLGIADGSDTYTIDGLNCVRANQATTFETALKTITDQVKDDEYMVLICTFAQGSYNYGNGQWRQAVSDACANNDAVFDGRNITPETVVGDVLGKVIVIVNTYTPGAISGSKCLFMDMGITLDEQDFTGSNYFEKPLQYENTTNSGITMYGTHAQITSPEDDNASSDERGYAPTLNERETKLNNILTWSKGNYDDLVNYKHNAWMYLGLGGYVYREYIWGLTHTEDYDDVAITLNGWIDGKIQDMPNSGYYPVGIVLMNYVEDYGSVIDDILQMNNKYRKAYDPHRSPVDGTFIDGTTGNSTVHSAAPGYSSGMKDNNTNAIGWTRCR